MTRRMHIGSARSVGDRDAATRRTLLKTQSGKIIRMHRCVGHTLARVRARKEAAEGNALKNVVVKRCSREFLRCASDIEQMWKNLALLLMTFVSVSVTAADRGKSETRKEMLSQEKPSPRPGRSGENSSRHANSLNLFHGNGRPARQVSLATLG